MYKSLFLFLALFSCFPVYSQDATEIRKLYVEGVKDEQKCKQLYDKLFSKNDISDPLILGYKGAVSMIMAKYTSSPMSKLNYFSAGKELVEKAVKLAPENTELRFTRFTLQENLPSFLMYSSNLDEDKKHILKHINSIEKIHLKQAIVTFLLKSKNCSTAEKATLEKEKAD